MQVYRTNREHNICDSELEMILFFFVICLFFSTTGYNTYNNEMILTSL